MRTLDCENAVLDLFQNNRFEGDKIVLWQLLTLYKKMLDKYKVIWYQCLACDKELEDIEEIEEHG